MVDKIMGKKNADGVDMSSKIDDFDEGSFDKAVIDMAKKTSYLDRQQDKYRQNQNRYMDVYASIASNAAQWKCMFITSFVVMLISIAANVYLSTSVRVQPYVVQVDEHGYAVPIAPADISNVDYRVITSQIAQFIVNSRIRVLDRDAQIYFANNAYKSIAESSPAYAELNRYFRSDIPTTAKDPIDIELQAVIPITEDTYQAEWIERAPKVKKSYQGIFEITVSPPDDVANLINNPLGVYINNFTVREKLN